MLSLCHLTPMLAWLVVLLLVYSSQKPCFSSSAYSLMPRPFQHVQEGQGTRLECICDFLYHCPGSPQGWGRNCETNALSIPTVVPRRGGWGISLIGALVASALLLLRLLNALICPKEVEASAFSLWRYRMYIQYCFSGCWSSWKFWL